MPWFAALDELDYGTFLGERGQTETALSRLDRAHERLAKLVQQVPQQALLRDDLCRLWIHRAVLLFQTGHQAEAATALEQAMRFDRGRYRHLLEFFRALTQARGAGQDSPAYGTYYEQATAEAHTLAATGPLSGNACYVLAMVFTLSAKTVSQETSLPHAERDKRTERYTTEALAFLTKARTAGYFRLPGRIEQLKKDQEFAPLRKRADFHQLVNELMKEIPAGAK
jgi:hypothetical protein